MLKRLMLAAAIALIFGACGASATGPTGPRASNTTCVTDDDEPGVSMCTVVATGTNGH